MRILAFLIWLVSMSPMSWGQAINQEAIDAIGRLTEMICTSISESGSQTIVSLGAEARAEAEGLLEKLADVSGGIDSDTFFTKYDNVERDQLPEKLKIAQDCRLEIFRELKNSIVSQTFDETTEIEKKIGLVCNLAPNFDNMDFSVVDVTLSEDLMTAFKSEFGNSDPKTVFNDMLKRMMPQIAQQFRRSGIPGAWEKVPVLYVAEGGAQYTKTRAGNYNLRRASSEYEELKAKAEELEHIQYGGIFFDYSSFRMNGVPTETVTSLDQQLKLINHFVIDPARYGANLPVGTSIIMQGSTEVGDCEPF